MAAWLRGFGAVLLLAGAVAAGEITLEPRSVGERVPPMTLYDLDGAPHTVGGVAEQGADLLLFWSVYCPDCKEAMPRVAAWYAARPAGDLRVWAVNVDGERFSNAVRAFVRDMELPFPVLYDRLEGDYFVAADRLGVSRTPTVFVVGPGGTVLHRQIVALDLAALAAAVPAAE